MSKLSVLIDTAYGDCGKSKAVSYLAKDFDINAKVSGGSNAGNVCYHEGKKLVLHQIPTGIIHPNVKTFIGTGCVVNFDKLIEEVKTLHEAGIETAGRILVSEDAHVVLPQHIEEDKKKNGHLGTTNQGIGPCYEDKVGRRGKRVKEFHNPQVGFGYYEVVKSNYIRKALEDNKSVLTMGSQGYGLDLDVGYPFCTSSNTTASAHLVSLGLPPQAPTDVYGVTKAYLTRVGSGPLRSELQEPLQSRLREAGGEYGSTTGRPRRCGWLDLDLLAEAVEVNGVTKLVITKSDILSGFEKVGIITRNVTHYVPGWKDLETKEFDWFLELVSEEVGIPRSSFLISNGPKPEDWK